MITTPVSTSLECALLLYNRVHDYVPTHVADKAREVLEPGNLITRDMPVLRGPLHPPRFPVRSLWATAHREVGP